MSFIVSCLLSSILGFIILKTKAYHLGFSSDNAHGIQKFHKQRTPRIGGIVLIVGLLSGVIVEIVSGNLTFILPVGLAISVFPVYFMGMLEDFTKKVHATPRFVMSIVSGVCFYAFMNVGITQTGLYWLDTHILSIPMISLILTTVIIAGVSNATNIIDGFNGLLLGFAVMATAGIGWVSYQVGDQQIFSMSAILLGSVLGLTLFNFPKGKIFTGDGGAYLIGFLLSALSILLVNRNDEVSPWFPMLLLLYPITETIFSIIRRIIIDNSSPFDPDNKHLHTLVYRLISEREKENQTPKANFKLGINLNAQTSLFIWPLMLSSILPSLIFWQDTSLLMIANGLFILGYYSLYKKLFQSSKSLSFN